MPLNQLCFEKILPLYERLTDRSLLSRCDRYLAQNANKSLHSAIWSKCAKEVFVAKGRVKCAASISVCEYNFGTRRTIVEIMKQTGLTIGGNALMISDKIDDRKLKRAVHKTTER